MAISLNKTITRTADNTIDENTVYYDLNTKAHQIVEDVVGKVETELTSAETQINSQIGALQSAEEYATSAASSASSASQIVLGQSTGRANIKPVLNLDFANQKRLDSKVDFTRTSTATYYDGKKQVKAEENLLKYSDDLSSFSLVGNGVAEHNSIVAPDGTLTATKVTDTDKTTYLRKALDFSADIGYTRSIYAKVPIGTATVTLAAHNSNGVVTLTDQWQRFEIKATSTAFIDNFYLVDFRHADCTATEVHIWHPQLEQRDFATAYTPTTDKPITNYIPVLSTAQANEPRFDYDLETKECKGLFIEEQRTNLIPYSNDLTNNPSYTLGAPEATTYIPNATIDIMGNNDAFKCIYGDVYAVNRLDIATIIGTEYTFSFYCKNIDAQSLNYRAYDLENGADIISSTSYLSQVSIDKWTRVSLTFTATSTSTGLYFQSGAGNGSAYFCGIQVEQGSFATSYIPTNGSQVTRTADNCSISGDNFSSFYNPSEGTFFADFESLHNYDGNPYPAVLGVSDGVYSLRNEITLFNRNTYCKPEVWQSGTQFTTPYIANARDGKASFAARNGNIGYSINGEVNSDYTMSMPNNMTLMSIGKRPNTLYGHSNAYIKKVAYYDKALTDTELQLMTQG